MLNDADRPTRTVVMSSEPEDRFVMDFQDFTSKLDTVQIILWILSYLHNYPMITVIAQYHTSKCYHLHTKTFCTEKQLSDIQFSHGIWVFDNSGSIKAVGYRQ